MYLIQCVRFGSWKVRPRLNRALHRRWHLLQQSLSFQLLISLILFCFVFSILLLFLSIFHVFSARTSRLWHTSSYTPSRCLSRDQCCSQVFLGLLTCFFPLLIWVVRLLKRFPLMQCIISETWLAKSRTVMTWKKNSLAVRFQYRGFYTSV